MKPNRTLGGKPGPGPWAEQAACQNEDPALFFPEAGDNAIDAKAVCDSCPVRPDCLAHALTYNERFGIWGGLSGREREQAKRNRRAA